MLKEIHLIHHTHTDFGYTDLPTTTWRLHVDYTRKALQLAQRYRHYPEEARFRWTCEVLFTVEAFLNQATPAEKRSFHRLVDDGLLGLTAMPCHLSPFVERPEWESIFERYAPILRRHKPTIAFQNDINGFPWGLMPLLAQHGVTSLWMGLNPYSGGAPRKAPYFWRWQGPDNTNLFVYLSSGYCAAYPWFHLKEWRRGPVPSSTSVWYHPPEPGDIWNTSPENLKQAHGICTKKHEDLLAGGYTYPLLGLQLTNMWRMDNDPPFEKLPDFVRAWNDAGYTPRLRLSTCDQFMNAFQKTAGNQFETLRGDWQDWWTDGIVSIPAEVSIMRKAQRDFASLAPAAKTLGVKVNDQLKNSIADLARDLILAEEHTWCGYASTARPFEPLTVGGISQKKSIIYQCHEDALTLQARIIRQSRHYAPSSHTQTLGVCNPRTTSASDWIEIPSTSLRFPANAARCQTTGRIYPLETTFGPEWPMGSQKIPDEYPNNVWPAAELTKCFFLHDVPAGKIMRFDLVELDSAQRPQSPWRGKNNAYHWRLDPKSGLLKELSWHGHTLLDTQQKYRNPGQIIIEQFPATIEARKQILYRDPKLQRTRTSPKLLATHSLPTAYGARYQAMWATPLTHRIEQIWDFLSEGDFITLTTTFWLKEQIDPMAIYVAFPFNLPQAKTSYTSLGIPTRVGTDQLDNSCGEHAAIGQGITWQSPNLTLSLESPDAPLCAFDSIATRTARKAFEPTRAAAFFMITNNLWTTNFIPIQPSKVTVRHIIHLSNTSKKKASPHFGGLLSFPTQTPPPCGVEDNR